MLKTSYTSAQYLNEANSLTYAYGKINAVVIADVDGNGFTDLVTFPSNFTTFPELQPLVWSNSNGVFSARPDLVSGPSSFQYFRDAVPGDFTGDGIYDYLMMDQGFELDNRNSAAFQFSQPKFYVGTGSGLKSVPTDEFLVAGNNDVTFNHIGASADFNADGKLDAVIASFRHLRILVNDGRGHFTTREDLVPVKFNDGTFSASGATFIRLGASYGLVAGAYRWFDPTQSPGDLAVLNQQNGFFVETQTLARPNLGQDRERNYGAVDMTNIDVNNDGREDLVVTWETEVTGMNLSNTIATVYFQDANGRLQTDPSGAVYNLAGKGAGLQIYFRDFNNDGYTDFWNSTFGIHPSKFNDLVWYNDGTGHFATNANGPFQTRESFPDWYLTNAFFFDANNDGVMDVVAARGVIPPSLTRNIGEQVQVFLGIDPVIRGTAKADRLSGTNDADSIQGLGGNDTLTGLAGDDTLDGGAGNDSMVGGLGDDTYYVDSTGDRVVELANQGTDTVMTSLVSYTLGSNVENLTYTGPATFKGKGNTLNNSIVGSLGSDILTGLAGNDTIQGGAGSDQMSGGSGNDVLTGGAAADYFVFDTAPGATNIDAITDFEVGVDKVRLSKSMFKISGSIKFADQFIVGTQAQDKYDRVIYDSAANKLYYDADGTGKIAPVQFAEVSTVGIGKLSAADFVLF
jgi:Ca2+-binding RTX toxin-like protein